MTRARTLAFHTLLMVEDGGYASDLLAAGSTDFDARDAGLLPKEVLDALPGMDAATAERIITFRNSSEIRGDAAVKDLLGAAYPLIAPYANADPGASTAFTIETTGYTDDVKKGYSIRATITLERSHQFRYLDYKSPAGFVQ